MHSAMLIGCILAVWLSSAVAKSVTQFPEVADDTHRKVEILPLSSAGWIREPRGHDYGKVKPKQGSLPDPVMISTSPIRVNNGDIQRNHHPIGKVKRQVLIQDASSYLGAQALLSAAQPQQEYIVHRDPVTGTFFGGTPAPLQFQAVTASPIPFQTVTASPIPYLNQLVAGNSRSSLKQNSQKPSKFLARQGGTDQQELISHEDSNSDHGNSEQVAQESQQVHYDHAHQILQALQTQQQHAELQQQAHEQLQHQQAQQHGSESHQTVFLSPSPASILPAQVQSNPQFIQIQQQPQLPPVQRVYQGQNGQTYIVHQAPMVTNAAVEGHSPQIGNFIVRPQTYVAGPGGQLFTVPVPIQQTSGEDNSRSSEDDKPERRRDRSSGEGSDQEEEHQPDRPIGSFMRRIMDAFSVRGDATERVGTNIALPVLASTGVFFGLGALAAGWYLSNGNREVGILRRTGKPVPYGTNNVQRIRRNAPAPPPEVDQSTFFQTIIQQAIEKQKDQFENTDEPQSGTVGESQNGNKYGRRKPHNRNDLVDLDELHMDTSPNSKVAERPIHHVKQWPSRHAINFAKVAIPALILGGAVIAIGVVIFGWYITGSNREIAFMEPSAYSRRKRDLATTALNGNGGLQRVLASVHENPYDENSIADHVFQKDSSNSKRDYEATNISDTAVGLSLAVVALLSLLGIAWAWAAANNAVTNSAEFDGWAKNLSRVKRSELGNPLTAPRFARDLTFIESLLENAQNRIPKLQESNNASPKN